MKNFPLISVLSLFALLCFSSCKKDYVCTCSIKVPNLFSFDSTGVSDTTYKASFDIDEASKKEAKNKCNGAEAGYKAFPLLALFGGAECSLEKNE